MSVKSGAGLPSSTTGPSSRRAIGVVRVSRVGDRDGERFVSPSEQAERIRSVCERDRLELLDVIEELGVSWGTPLAKRAGLWRAVELRPYGSKTLGGNGTPSVWVRTGGRFDCFPVGGYDRWQESMTNSVGRAMFWNNSG